MNNRYKNILLYIILVISSIDCCVMFAWNKKEVFICTAIGVLVSIFLCRLYSGSRQYIGKINKIISLVVGLLFCFYLSTSFYQTWITVRTVKVITDLLSINAAIFMKILSFGMALMALPSVACGLIKINQLLVYCYYNLIDIRKVWKLSISSFSVKSLLSIIANVGGASILGTILLIGVYSLPIASIDDHVDSSAKIFENEGTYPYLFSWCASQLDNFTDAIMLLEAADDTNDSTINKAMLNYRGVLSDYNAPSEVLVAHYINGFEYDEIETYARYWHGYHVLLKPLLEFMDYQSIRILNTIAQLLLVTLVSYLLIWHKMKEYVIPYLLSYLMLMPVALAKSLQFSSCFYILTFAMIAILLLKNNRKNENVCFIFLNIGIATSFFDFLTYPLATFGIPALLFLFMHSDHALERRLSDLLKSLFCWGVGYVGMWSLKWVIASLITGSNVILNGLQAVSNRTANSSPDGSIHYSLLRCELNNVAEFLFTPFTLLVAAFIILTVISISRKKYITYVEACKQLIPYIIVALMPFLWYAFARNHSATHYRFTNKACVVSVFAIMCGLVEIRRLCESRKKEETTGGKD